MRLPSRANELSVALACALAACSPSSPRDVVPESRDVVAEREPAKVAAPDTYEHIAKRAHGTLALAESRGMAKADAAAVVDDLADRFEQCATGLEAQGLLVDGAARVVAEQEAGWSAPAAALRLAPGGAVAQNALLCLVAPLRAGRLPPENLKARAGIAIEATWQPIRLGTVSDPAN